MTAAELDALLDRIAARAREAFHDGAEVDIFVTHRHSLFPSDGDDDLDEFDLSADSDSDGTGNR